MYKIMIADDEGITVDALRFIIERNYAGQCIIESAKSGREVIELAETFRPDIAFMDIHMPGINGIEAIREIKNTQPGIIFIIISAYDKFSYAKTAIELGVLKYINKPIVQDQIVSVLSQAMTMLDEKREKRREDLKIREKLENVIPIIENGFIYDLLFKEQFGEDIDVFKNLIGIKAEYGYMIACVFGEQQDGNHMTNVAGATVSIQKYYKDMKSVIEEHFKNAIVSNTMANKIVIFIPYEKSTLDYEERTALVENGRSLVHILNTKFNICTRIGFGSVKEIKDMSDSYKEAMTSLSQSERSIAHAEDVSVNVDYEENYPIDIERSMFQMIEVGNVNESIIAARRYYDWLVNYSEGAEGDIRLKVIEFVLWAERIAYLNTGMSYVFKSRTNYLSMAYSLNVENELLEWFIDRIGQAARNVADTKTNKSNSIINKAIEYIKKNYTKNISLEDVSMSVNVTSYYFSRLFKEEVGVNFVEYVAGLRIEKAKELLNSPDMPSMKEICLDVGYSDPNYFSRIFKKHEGLSPTEYREGLVKR